MGVCIKDHSEDDIFEKLEDVREQITDDIFHRIVTGIEQGKFQQPTLNEIFHALKKLEKKITEEEKNTVLGLLQNI